VKTFMENRSNIFGTVLSGGFAWAAHFETHSAAYASAAAIISACFVISNVIVGWVRLYRKKRKNAVDEESTKL
jgi:hypothetical protein